MLQIIQVEQISLPIYSVKTLKWSLKRTNIPNPQEKIYWIYHKLEQLQKLMIMQAPQVKDQIKVIKAQMEQQHLYMELNSMIK